VDIVERQGSSTRHPWEVARAEFFLRLLERHGLLESGDDWLDAGAGDAWFARQLRRVVRPAATITCWDIKYTPEDLEAEGSTETQVINFVADRPSSRFDRILMLDLIEHVEDDVGFVTATVDDLLVDNGLVLVSVPAYQALYSSHDRTFHHYRRYSPVGCRRLLEHAGLAVLSSGGLFFSLLPARLGQLLVERVRPASSLSSGVGDWNAARATTRTLTRALITDGRLSLLLSERGLSLPGLSYWALCRLQST
jgi:hypothetical protein